MVFLCLSMGIGLIGCGHAQTGALSFQEKECRFTAACRVKAAGDGMGGDYVVEILHRPDGSGELIFLSPETIAGCKYLRTPGGEYSFQTGDLLFPVVENPTTKAIFGMFSLSEDNLVKAKTDKENGEGVNVLTFDEEIMLYLDRYGMPLYYDHPVVALTIHK